jgi:cytochrome oxidase assembly protein ShyY1
VNDTVKRWRFAFSRRWLGYLAFAVAFAIACGCLSAWQLARSKEAAAANAIISKNFHAQPVPLDQALPDLHAFTAGQKWMRVQMSGTYVQRDQLLVRNRATDSGPGFEVLTPLKLSDGSLFIVDRGWVPVGNSGNVPESVPPASTGQVTVVVRLKPSEPRLPGQSRTGDQVPTVELPDIAAELDTPTYTGAYGLLDTQTPDPAHQLTPVVTSAPVQDEGLHWSYMIQWIIFALIGFFGLGYAIRQEYKHRNEDDPAQRAREKERERRRAVRPKSDAEIEDELLDHAPR